MAHNNGLNSFKLTEKMSVNIDNLEPYSYNVKDYKDMDSWNKRKSHSLLNPKYYKLLFLKESKIFLREVFLNRSADELAQGISGLKKSMMILDQNLILKKKVSKIALIHAKSHILKI